MTKPRLRGVQTQMIQHRGQPAILLRDPLLLSSRAVALPVRLAPLLGLCDGTRDAAGLRAALMVRAGVSVSPTSIENIIREMDEACLFDNERFAEALTAARREFREAPFRPPTLAGGSYPADPAKLRTLLNRFVERVSSEGGSELSSQNLRGLISPHIDYRRGGLVYARVWHTAREALREADLIIILGTDHLGGGLATLTRQSYATPWGVLPTAVETVDFMAEAVGRDIVFDDELHHRSEHSIELASVWLHYVLGENTPQVVPVLCGSFDKFIEDGADPATDEFIDSLVRALNEAAAGRKTIVIAAADLSHVGPAFGDALPVDFARRARVKGADEEMLGRVARGDAEGFVRQLRDEGDSRRVCGLPAIYLMLRLLGNAQGTLTDYVLCPADAQNTSLVSICGMLLK